ncbi:MAG TPA: phosphoribosylaminoimidazolesuccinocarboxamide synthase [Candidatus Margulisbacteria bacterium]|nr:MAG: phosphoribosylaminoimidazolesuccinocarboxamide synthase [Candidatus Margulisbacteria bacterium GWD2_39_127]OGI07813.1 MAG: phosphoribosylaminoimidazolesuccinocarboxamide synthase [Candidatus Margulisbacteria bacterium GWE2_39_32]HAR62603.1 phosphoribosylaminoimidazolesuccinocarboxamide synthase [Candidatus Margulisiibacteriota bacterium]HCT84330.1 phosphoribosylaminoimidazolesuccinocarboxamide synthase [Candidatus Margulisiibacteriota bacterium]
MQKIEMLYEGKAKRIYKTEQSDLYISEFKDDATAFNGAKKGTIENKGVVNTKISARLFELLEKNGIPTHFVKLLSENEMLVKKVTIIPIEVVIRNIVAGSMAKNLGLKEGLPLAYPVLDLYYKDDSLNDPMITEYHVKALNYASDADMNTIKVMSLKINDILKGFFKSCGIDLVDFKLEFGKTVDGNVVLADEISPDTCRFWDSQTGEKLDKDRFRRDLGNVEGSYQEMLRRVTNY